MFNVIGWKLSCALKHQIYVGYYVFLFKFDFTIRSKRGKFKYQPNGSGRDDRATRALDTRGQWFGSKHQELLLNIFILHFLQIKDTIEEKRLGWLIFI